MNESTLTQAFLRNLRKRGAKVFKHADKMTVGVPDASASQGGVTTWYEFKCIEVARPAVPAMVDWSRIIGPDDMVQLLNMCELEHAAKAKYILFQVTGRRYVMSTELPSRVFDMVRRPVRRGSRGVLTK